MAGVNLKELASEFDEAAQGVVGGLLEYVLRPTENLEEPIRGVETTDLGKQLLNIRDDE